MTLRRLSDDKLIDIDEIAAVEQHVEWRASDRSGHVSITIYLRGGSTLKTSMSLKSFIDWYAEERE
jgi:hypothetical protein